MSRVLGHTPAWLSRPAAGFQVFQPTKKHKAHTSISNGYGKKVDYRGPARLLTHRGTEIIFVVDGEIRWADLINLKETQDEQTSSEDSKDHRYRVLKAPTAGKIRQLVISPHGDFLAIATSHTVHVAVLPTSIDVDSHEPLRLKTFQLGPTAHVLEQAPVASVLWHPLGALGSCLVTVTSDACVRLWELNTDSRHSFDEPCLALDLKKLANAASYGEDMRASVYGTSKGFSPDQVEMEVAAACFGGIGTSDELGWAAMTLWVAMTEGDVYALCPLIPSKWQPAASTIPSLSTSVVSKAAILDQDQDVPESRKRQAVQQQKWLADLDAQQPIVEVLPGGMETVEIYQRPSHPPAVPKLQGPFSMRPEPEFGIISDIVAVAPKLDEDPDGDEDEYGEDLDTAGLSVGLICLLTQSCKIHVCLDVSGVEAAWLPTRRTAFTTATQEDALDLVVLETVQLGVEDVTSWPSFTKSISNRHTAVDSLNQREPGDAYALLVTTDTGVYTLDLNTLAQTLEDELSGPSDTGASFRVGILLESDCAEVDNIIKFTSPTVASAAATIVDSDLGHFILTLAANQPYAVNLETTSSTIAADPFAPDVPLLLAAPETREVYQPDESLFAKSKLSSHLDQLHQTGFSRLKHADLVAPLKLSPATLHLLTETHRIVSEDFESISVSSARLFRQCTRMQTELADQIQRVREIRDRMLTVSGGEAEESSKDKVERRVAVARDRQAKLSERIDATRKKLARVGNVREFSKKEEAWAAEVEVLQDSLEKEIDKRISDVKTLKESLIERTANVIDKDKSEENIDRGASDANEMRRRKLDQVMVLLERETALVDAVSERLSRLSSLAVR